MKDINGQEINVGDYVRYLMNRPRMMSTPVQVRKKTQRLQSRYGYVAGQYEKTGDTVVTSVSLMGGVTLHNPICIIVPKPEAA